MAMEVFIATSTILSFWGYEHIQFSIINKSVDWTPNYHKTARTFPQISPPPPDSVTKLTPNEPAMRR